MRKITAALIDGHIMTNSPKAIIAALKADRITDWIDQRRLQLMGSFDLGPQWKAAAKWPVLFQLDDDGKPYPADYKEDAA